MNTEYQHVSPEQQLQLQSILFYRLLLCLYSLLPFSPLLLSLLKLCQNTHILTHDLPTSFSTSCVASSVSVCTFPLFSGGERWYEHDRVRVSLQLWDGERQENRHCFGNRYSFRLHPLLLVRHSFKPFASMLHKYKPNVHLYYVSLLWYTIQTKLGKSSFPRRSME